MTIAELYTARALDEAFDKLQKYRIRKGGPKLFTVMESPEILDDKLLMNWLALNYTWAVDFDKDGKLLMGEIGGIIPTQPEKGDRILAISEASLAKTTHGIAQVQESRKSGDVKIIVDLEREIETVLESREDITIINGNRNIAHYDFTTSVARTNPIELLTTNSYLLFAADGVTVISNKCLTHEQYVFNIPVNEQIFEKMKSLKSDNVEASAEARLSIFNSMKDVLLPEQFIAGFHIEYQKEGVTVRPLITQRDADVSRRSYISNPVPSEINYLGISSPHGDFGLLGRVLIN